jgi:pyruvate dehydrogenase E2 component (dihydrolipoamide acetyltransferase)
VSSTFVMPLLGADMTAGRLAHWYRAPGDAVQKGDIVAAVETDKGVIDVECFADGVIGARLVDEGQEVPVGTPLATILAPGESVAASAPAPVAAAAPVAPAEPAAPPAAPRPEAVPEPAAPSEHHVSPLAARFARAHGIDPAVLRGTGAHGRTVLRDVKRALGNGDVPPPATHPPSTPAARERAVSLGVDLKTVTGSGPGGRIMRRDVEAAAPAVRPPTDAFVRMRRAIAASMSRANREIPHYYVGTTIDLSNARAWLTAYNEARPVSARLLIGVLLVKAVALALRDHPDLNAVWQDEQVVRRHRINVGVAVSLRGGGLVAPALHDADGRSLDELMEGFRDVVTRARRGGLRSSELSDPTITVTSLGDEGVEEVYGVVFPPQVAIVGFGRVVDRPWVVGDRVEPRTTVRATLSGDHRVTDGHAGSAFLRALDRLLQEPDAL